MKKLLLTLTLIGMLMPSATSLASTPPAAVADPQRFSFEFNFITNPFSWGGFFGNLVLAGVTAGISGYAMKYVMEKSSFTPQPTKTNVKLKDIVGSKPKELENLVNQIHNPWNHYAIGVKFPKSILLDGPPGTGKTQLARGIANELGATYYEICGSGFSSKWAGEASKNIEALFKEARKAPLGNNMLLVRCVIFIDELETIAPSRESGITRHHDNQTLGTLLTEMTKKDENAHILIIGATNHKKMLDTAILRPGRFDSSIHINLPNTQDRKLIMEHHAKKYTLDSDSASVLYAKAASLNKKRKLTWKDVSNKLPGGKLSGKCFIDFQTLAQMIEGFSGAHIEELCAKAARFAATANESYVSQNDFEEAIVAMNPDKENDKAPEGMYC